MGSPDCYPGADARADELIRLANHYRGAANDLLRLVEEKGARRIAPCRLCAVHAIELYLNAFLLKLGHPPERIRDSGHDLAARAALASAGGLALRRRTAIHLATMTLGREYLVAALRPGHGRGGAAQPALGHPRRDRPQGHERGRRLRPAGRGLSAARAAWPSTPCAAGHARGRDYLVTALRLQKPIAMPPLGELSGATRPTRRSWPASSLDRRRVPRRAERSGGAGPGPLGQVEVVVLLHEGIGEALPPPGEEGGVGEVGGDIVHRRFPIGRP